MKKHSTLPLAAIVIGFCGAFILAWYLIVPNSRNFQTAPESQVKIVAPAHEIPPQVAQNMQEALAEREKKLQALQAVNDSKHKAK